jgi:hypothetical protein
MNEGVIAAIVIVSIFLVIFGFAAFTRYLRYKENIAAIEKGLLALPARSPRNGNGALRWGVIITALGLALCIGLYPFGFINDAFGSQFPLYFGPWMLLGLLPTFFGAGLILIHVLTRKDKDTATTEPSVGLEAELDAVPELEAVGNQSD